MEFHVYRCQIDKDFFVVTDEKHLDALKKPNICPTPGDKLDKVGIFGELGKSRAAFDEEFARRSIDSQGFYRFHSKTYDPLGEPPLGMPV